MLSSAALPLTVECDAMLCFIGGAYVLYKEGHSSGMFAVFTPYLSSLVNKGTIFF